MFESLDNLSFSSAGSPSCMHKNLGFGDLCLVLDSKLVKDAVLFKMEVV
jgi:hypothetical protein